VAKFRKKPVVIEAQQFFYEDAHWPAGVEGGSNGHPYIRTLEGDMRVSDGDWVITGVKGEKYPCKDEIFRATYAPAPSLVSIEIVFDALRNERAWQDQKWGDPLENPHSLGDWILLACARLDRAMTHRQWGASPGPVQEELLQLAALCVAALQQHGVQERVEIRVQDAMNGHNAQAGLQTPASDVVAHEIA